MELFEVKVKYDKIVENGLIKKIPEQYVVDALSFTEAEERITQEISVFSSGEFEVTDIKKARITEVIESEDAAADKWYKARVAFIVIDEKTEKEKRAIQTMLVQGTSLQTAWFRSRSYSLRAWAIGSSSASSKRRLWMSSVIRHLNKRNNKKAYQITKQ